MNLTDLHKKCIIFLVYKEGDILKKKKHKKQSKKEQKKLLVEKQYEEIRKKRVEIENDINETLDGLSVEELSELETMGDFSEEAIEWIRARKKRKKARKAQEDFEKRMRCSNEVIRRTELIGKIFGLKNGSYKPKSKEEAKQLKKEIEQDIEKEQGDSRNSKGGASSKDDRSR